MAVRISGTKKNIRWQKMAHNCYYVYYYQGSPYYISGTNLTTDIKDYRQTLQIKCTQNKPILDGCTPAIMASKIAECQVTGDEKANCSDSASECLKYGWIVNSSSCYCPKKKPQ